MIYNKKIRDHAKQLAELTLASFCPSGRDNEPMDGDETEYMADEYLKELNKLMGNK